MARDKRLIISLDVDDVLAEFMISAMAALGSPSNPNGHSLTAMYHDREAEARALVIDPAFHARLSPVIGAVRGTVAMKFWYDAEIAYVSARLPEVSEITNACLNPHNPPDGDR